MIERVTEAEAQRIFGADAAGYDAGRPPYPAAVFDILADRCGLVPGAAVFEIGPGTGQATRAILDRGAAFVIAIEPDPALAAYLRAAPGIDRARVCIVEAVFADAPLQPSSFDLGIAATSFHWLEAAPSLARVRSVLKPGGHWAMWWSVYRDPGSDHPFERAIEALLARYPLRPARGTHSVLPFGLDREARLGDLATAGLIDPRAAMLRWSQRMDAVATVALLDTFSPVRLLPPDVRAALLDDVRHLVDRDFGGAVDRWFTTALYTARNPG